MTTFNHTAYPTGGALTAVLMEAPLGQLDAAIKKNNYVATAAPTTGDDSNDGYTVGSRWIDITNDRAYVAVDVTPSAAIWKEMSFPSSVTQNFSVTGVLTVTGTESITGATAALTITYTGNSSPSVGPSVNMIENDGAAMGSLDRLGTLAFGGHNGVSAVNGAFVIVQTTELWSSTARGSKFSFYTTPNTTTSLTLALTINHNQDLDSAGNINIASGKVYKVNNVQVTGARDTGWSPMTGSANKATSYDVATVTLPQLAGRVKSLQDALSTHGMIGA